MKRKTIFIETFESVVKVCGVEYSIHQDQSKLQIKIKETQEPIYTYDINDQYVLKYKKTHIDTIHKVFKLAKVDRYVL